MAAGDGPIQIMVLNPGNDECPVELLLDNLDQISNALKQERCDYVSIISVMGAYRTGKSFLLDLLMRYLRSRARREASQHAEATSRSRNTNTKPWSYGQDDGRAPPDWVLEGDAQKISEGNTGVSDARGFGWRSGKEKCTTGIWLWSKPFVLHDLKGRRVGVLLMDTQGAWDGEMSNDQSATIFGMTALLSSKLIYNIQNRVDSDKLGNLDFFTSFAEKACGAIGAAQDGRKPFGHLEFLIRDWNLFEEGWSVGKCKEMMDDHLCQFLQDDKVAHKEIADRLRACFNKMECYGLCDPGKKVKGPKYDGAITDIDQDFLYLMDSFAEYFFGEGFPCPSAPLGVELTAAAFSQTIKNFSEAFANSTGMALGLRDAFVKVQMMQEREQLVKQYRAWLLVEFPDHTVLDPAIIMQKTAAKQAEFKANLHNKVAPFHLTKELEEELQDALMEELGRETEKAVERNNALVDGAAMKVVASPVVCFAAYTLAAHLWIVGALGLFCSWVSMKKHSNRQGVELCHTDVFQGLMQDVQRFAMERYKDVQAMAIAVQRMEFNKIVDTVIGAGAKAVAGANQNNEKKKNE